MSEQIAVLFTAKSVERILREGGTSAWRLDRSHARRCAYAVCTRNAGARWVEGKEEHRSAFLVGKIGDVVPCKPTPENHEAPDNRFLITFSEYALVDMPDVWAGGRNPVKYESAEALGIDFSSLKWERMPEPDNLTAPSPQAPHPVTVRSMDRPLTMAEAKKGLALTFNVPTEAIEITIRG
jgi:hypothetical protein